MMSIRVMFASVFAGIFTNSFYHAAVAHPSTWAGIMLYAAVVSALYAICWTIKEAKSDNDEV